MMAVLWIAAITAGVVSTMLAGANAKLATTLAQPITAGLIVEGVVTLSLLAIGLTYGGLQWPAVGAIGKLPWWAWLGGIGGASMLLVQLLVAEKLGAAVFTALTVTAGVIMSIAMDNFGWVGFERQPAHLDRLIGGAMMIAGVALVARN